MTIKVAPSVLDTMREEIALTPPHLETGGILLGTRDPWIVTMAGRAGPGAIRTPTFFLRDLEYTQKFAAIESKRSGAMWIGEWHTHPSGPDHPSATDLGTYENLQYETDGSLQAGVISIIVTRRNRSLNLTAWTCFNRIATQLHVEEQ
ncbi:Mov34/MPN/PAD-1 family protein [Nesterenkonia halotolerans]|uniref:Mov34/MPN/PAD-1 family protein n=1 Tax=Nesterenkonia halotolerans TaxID=225325 RepID=UPI003EE7CDF2